MCYEMHASVALQESKIYSTRSKFCNLKIEENFDSSVGKKCNTSV